MILCLDQVSITFGRKPVLRGISCEIARGETVALMGPNGAGKTTVLRCILGLLRYEGTITVDGLDARRQGVAARERIGYVPQVPAFYHDMTARQVVHFVARLRGIPLSRADEALRRIGLEGDASRPVHVFSGGMQQRLSLAAALLADPPIILLDEPTANLDPQARADLLGLLSELRAAGKTLLLSSHRPREIQGLADRVILLREGVIAAQGKPETVLPSEKITLSVEAHSAKEKEYLATLMAHHQATVSPSSNGTLDLVVPASHIVNAIERLRDIGVARSRIALQSHEEGGLQ